MEKGGRTSKPDVRKENRPWDGLPHYNADDVHRNRFLLVVILGYR
jgi:hypothetical protein